MLLLQNRLKILTSSDKRPTAEAQVYTAKNMGLMVNMEQRNDRYA